MQPLERHKVQTHGGSQVVLQYDGDDIWTIEREQDGDVLTLTREELYDICQVVFARSPGGYRPA